MITQTEVNNKLYQVAFGSVPLGMIIVNKDGNTVQINSLYIKKNYRKHKTYLGSFVSDIINDFQKKNIYVYVPKSDYSVFKQLLLSSGFVIIPGPTVQKYVETVCFLKPIDSTFDESFFECTLNQLVDSTFKSSPGSNKIIIKRLGSESGQEISLELVGGNHLFYDLHDNSGAILLESYD